ncbi:MAG TPA: response regulator [Anaerolineales bacterium]|nr:response regulator [Anaerolineales bacterium]
MPYKVLFVEDEIVTREGIRDNVDWKANGFEYCGEATDGEMALSLLQAVKPDILITDIKMPFMDGLQLCKIVRERLPWIKIIILSGHDEFEYAQEAIKLGVTEYLLKPITVQNMHRALLKIATQLDKERKEQENLKKLQEQLEENQAMLREGFLLKLVSGAVASTEAIEKGESLGLDLIARYYLVVILKIEIGDRSEQFDYDEYQQIQNIVSSLVGKNPDIFFIKKDWEEIVLLMKGNTSQYLEEERELLLGAIAKEVEKTRYWLTVGAGTQKNRITDIYQSFIEAFANIQNAADQVKDAPNHGLEKAELLKLNKSAVETYLSSGALDGFEDFFSAYLQPLGETALKSHLIKNYIFMDLVLGTAKLVNELGGDMDAVLPELNSIESILKNIKTIDQLKEQAYRILANAFSFRDGQNNGQHPRLIRQAKEYIDQHYMDPELSLNEVASLVNLSSSHFSMVFSQETRQTFKEYLTTTRINKAKGMLRTTSLGSNDIAYQVGFNDPHYFSYVFKKNTGMSPTEFRSKKQAG